MPQVFTAIITKALAGTALGAFLGSTIGNLLIGLAFSALSQVLAKQKLKKERPSGIRSDFTTTGETNAQAMIVGRYFTAGHLLAPPMTYGPDSVPNEYLTYVIALNDKRRASLHQVVINDEVVALGGTAEAAGFPGTGDYAGWLWVRFWDGTQGVADPWLISTYGTGTDHATETSRPWLSDMVGPDVCYATVTFRLNRTLYPGFPSVGFVLESTPLYDPRLDDTVGGTGDHRWANQATWEATNNPAVIIYNILRGIPLPDGSVWGGRNVDADDLPLDNWFAAMNACDVLASSLPIYRAGYEIRFTDQPMDVIDELKKGCAAQITEIGGVWKIRVGPPGLPVYTFTDDDVIASEALNYTPFSSIQTTFNGITASYPSPASLWQTKDAPARYNATWEAEDGGQRLVAHLDFPAVPYPGQVQRLMAGYIKDERRFARHSLALPPDAAILEPLDAVAWTSTINGYTDKLFEVTEVADDFTSLVQRVAIRERDPDDYDWAPEDELDEDFSPVTVRRPTAVPASFAVAEKIIRDASNVPRRVGLTLSWDAAGTTAYDNIIWQVRRSGETDIIANGLVRDPTDLSTIATGPAILPGATYEARIRFGQRGVKVGWTSWVSATIRNVKLGVSDLTVPDFSGNLVTNGDIQDELDPGWTNIATTFSRIARGSSGAAAVIAAPSPFILQMDVDAADQNAWIGDFPARSGQEFALTFEYAASGATRDVSFRLTIIWRDADGAALTAGSVTVLNANATTWASATNSITAPANTAAGSIRIVRLAGGAGLGYVTGIEVTRKRTAVKTLAAASVTKGEIQEGAVSVSAFSVENGANLALTGTPQLIGQVRGITPEAYVPDAIFPRNPMSMEISAIVSVTGGSATIDFNLERRTASPVGSWSTVLQFKYTLAAVVGQIVTVKKIDGYGASAFISGSDNYQYRFAPYKVSGAGAVEIVDFTATYEQVNK